MFDDEDYELIVKTIIEEVKGRVPVIVGDRSYKDI